ncbi:MAG: 2-hydroxy-acid oxidase, partial [Planctomycetes bacterium]|nr:2-hydroxy-acid oxidase [Planctomycetota bacterium]
MKARPQTRDEVVEAVRESSRVLPVAGRTKPTLATTIDVELLDLSELSGIVEYDPSEYVFTAKAGTLVAEVQRTLREHGQYLPFDPPFAEHGSTLGGMAAAGLNGPGRLRFGGIRDFLIGVTFVDGGGCLSKGGGKVVKNAAGFDFPKFFVGSLGRFGVLTELSFKVFPQPENYVTLRIPHNDLAAGMEGVLRIASSPWEPDALEIESSGEVFLRLGGTETALPQRVECILGELSGMGERLADEEADKFWREANAFGWASPEAMLIKVPV